MIDDILTMDILSLEGIEDLINKYACDYCFCPWAYCATISFKTRQDYDTFSLLVRGLRNG